MSDIDFDQVIQAIRSATNRPDGDLILHEPDLTGEESDYVQACIKSTFVSSVGEYVDRFELELAEYLGSKKAVVVSNGTAALQVALHLVGVRSNDEVLMPALTFVATANAAAHCRAIPHFVDSHPSGIGIDVEKFRKYLTKIVEHRGDQAFNILTGRRLAAFVPMNTFGHPVQMLELKKLCSSYGIPLVEDAAESLGSTYGNRHAGTFGDIGIVSFNGNKIITTGGGGAIVTDDEELARRAKHLTTTAKKAHAWEYYHDEVAWNYRMPNLNAALGCAQLKRLEEFVQSKRTLASRYQEAFKNIQEIECVVEPPNTRSNYWLNAIRLSDASIEVRDELLSKCIENGLHCRPCWNLLSELPMYLDCPASDLSNAQEAVKAIVCIPSSSSLGVTDG